MSLPGNLLLDTSVVIRHFKQDFTVEQVLKDALELYVPSIVLGELYYGAYNSGYVESSMNTVNAFILRVIVLYPDEKTADCYGQIRSQLKQKGLPIPDNDIWVAATAMSNDIALYAKDAHFERIEGIKYISP